MMKNDLRPQPEPELKPEGVSIVSFNPMPMPGAMPGTVSLAVYGLGSDERVYFYTSKGAFWTLLP